MGRFVDYLTESVDVLDNQSGAGVVEYNSEVDYFGFRAMMTPSKFLSLSLPLDINAKEQEYIDKMEQFLKDGGKVASPWLEIKAPEEWIDGNVAKSAKIVNHEGRHRMLAIQQYKARNRLGQPNEPIEVHLFIRGYRARDITPEMKQRLNDNIVSQRGYQISGPWFALL